MRLRKYLFVFISLFSSFAAHADPFDDIQTLTPQTLGSRDEDVRNAMAERRFEDAAKALDGKTPELKFLKAWLWSKANNHEKVKAALKEISKKDREQIPELACRLALLEAESELNLKNPKGAIAAVKKAPTEKAPTVAKQLQRILARALREAGNYKESALVYHSMIAEQDAEEVPVALLGLARVYIEQKKNKEAVQLLRRLDLEFPLHWAAAPGKKAAKDITAKDAKLAKLYKNRTSEEQIARAEILLKANHNAAVVEALTPLKKSKLKGNLLCRHRYALGRAQRKMRKWKDAAPNLTEAVSACSKAKNELAPWAIYLSAQAQKQIGNDAESLKLYRQLQKQYPKHNLADDAAYFEIRALIEDSENFKTASDKALKMDKSYPNGDMNSDALFFVAAKALEKDDKALALKMLQADAKRAEKPFDHAKTGRTTYWLGRMEMEKDLDNARELFRKVAREAPLSWYAILSLSRLEEMSPGTAEEELELALSSEPPAEIRKSFSKLTPPKASKLAQKRVVTLARLGLAEEAQSDLRALEQTPSLFDSLLLDHAGAYPLSHNILRRKLSTYRKLQPNSTYLNVWKLAYPRAFESLVKAASTETGTPEMLIFAAMREESGFSPAAESFANAKGLMQVIMTTARSMSKPEDGTINEKTVKNPALNIKLGARYLAKLPEQTGAVQALWPAGYNAGGGALKRWLQARGDQPLDLFVELIPFEEARGYTKRVNASFATYSFLYGENPGVVPLLTQDLKRSPKTEKPKEDTDEDAP